MNNYRERSKGYIVQVVQWDGTDECLVLLKELGAYTKGRTREGNLRIAVGDVNLDIQEGEFVIKQHGNIDVRSGEGFHEKFEKVIPPVDDILPCIGYTAEPLKVRDVINLIKEGVTVAQIIILREFGII